jgi:ABC-type uncharacterized transport system substrate-binding protein
VKLPFARVAYALILILAPAAAAYAHPHVFITSHVAFDFDGTTLTRVSVSWTFDELFSQMILADYDRGRKGSFSDAEAAELKKGAFDNLRNYHYFLALFIDGKHTPLPPIQNFKPSINTGRLVYSFSLPLSIKIESAGRELRLTIYDDTYYVAFDKMIPAQDIELRSSTDVASTVGIEKTKVKAEWPGQFMPDQIVLRMKGK